MRVTAESVIARTSIYQVLLLWRRCQNTLHRAILSVFILYTVTSGSAAETLSEAVDKTGANIVFMRHTLAPGFGDPEHFALRDCSTQRNLSKDGIIQAQQLGHNIRQSGVAFDLILSSQWCRCLETARNLELGPFSEFPGLNSFFQGYANRTETLNMLNNTLSEISENDLVLMVTHQVVISAVTGISVPSGGVVLYNTAKKTAYRFQFETTE